MANLNVYIDTAQEWIVRVMDGQILEYNVNDPKKITSISDLRTLVPEIGVTYVLDKAPYTEYTWDGENLISNLNASQTTLIKTMANSEVAGVTYNGSGKISGYTKAGVAHTVTYPDANTYVFSNDTGVVKIVTVDGSDLSSQLFN